MIDTLSRKVDQECIFIFLTVKQIKLEVRNMERKLSLTWNIYNGEIDRAERYCHNCGKQVEFVDSLKRRQNANGKNIFHFAIFKCPKGHTWNKRIDIFKAIAGLKNDGVKLELGEMRYDELSIANLIEEGIYEVEIYINILEQKVRVDKFLSSRIQDITRAEITKLINEGFIKINGNKVKTKTALKEKDIIMLDIR